MGCRGEWEDAWDGSSVTGPKTVEATQPYERQPMWHRKDGGLTVMTDSPGLRIEEGDWSSLTLEAFPSQAAMETHRSVYAQDTHVRHQGDARTDLAMRTDGKGKAHFEIAAATDGAERAWVLRVHLRPSQFVTEAVMDGATLADDAVVHLAPLSEADTAHYFPFGGSGSHPPVNAGHVAELKLPSAAHARSLSLTIV